MHGILSLSVQKTRELALIVMLGALVIAAIRKHADEFIKI